MSSEAMTVQLGLGEGGLSSGCGGCGDCRGSGGGGSGGCGCGGASCACGDCAAGVSERPRWFAGQLVGPADLESLQQWVIGRARRHNRMLHGWGVSCGLGVEATRSPSTGDPVPWSVTIDTGYALSACGDEVSLPCPVRIDVRAPRPDTSDVCAPPVDPWCAPVRERRDPEHTYYLAIRYAESNSRPVRASACGCGCDDDPCEYSRIAEGYTLAILDELPDCYEQAGTRVYDDALHREYDDINATWISQRVGTANSMDDKREAVGCSSRMRAAGTRPCPDCCSPWVVLADLTVDANGTIVVDTLAHRRFAVSFGAVGFTCAPQVVDDPMRRIMTQAEREVMKSSFATSASDLAETAQPAGIVAAPALSLKGATRTKGLRELVGNRTVAEFARADVDALRAAAIGAGVEPEAIDHVHALASLVARVAGL